MKNEWQKAVGNSPSTPGNYLVVWTYFGGTEIRMSNLQEDGEWFIEEYGFYGNGKFGEHEKVSHWMELPELPEN